MLPDDQIRFLGGTIALIPLSFALRYLPTYQIRIYYSLSIGILLQFYIYGTSVILTLGIHVLMYQMIKRVNRQKCGLFAITFSMIILSSYFAYVMIVDYGRWELDISTILMMSVCKYSLFAYSYQDGKETKDKIKYQQRDQEKLEVLPSFFDFLNYMIFLPSCLINTPFDYVTFRNYMKKQKQFSSIPLKQLLINLGKESIKCGVCAAIYIFSLIYFPTTTMNEESYIDQGVFHHFWYGYICINLHISRYFLGFILMQLPIHASGVSYKLSNSGNDFEGIRTMDIYKFEAAYHTRDKVNSWNMAVQEWLRKCVYQRLPYDKATNQFLTFLISAFWHGFYPGCYVTFVLFFLQIYTGSIIYKFSVAGNDHPIVKYYQKTQKYSFYVCWAIWNWIFVINSTYFIVLSWQRSFVILSEMYFATPIILIILGIFFKAITPRKKSQKQVQ